MIAVVGAPDATPESLGGGGKGGVGWVCVVGADDAGEVDLGVVSEFGGGDGGREEERGWDECWVELGMGGNGESCRLDMED